MLITSFRDYGYFYATLRLGTPPREFAVIVDTGSTITYVPCASCGAKCGPHHKDAAFDPAASSTAKPVACDSNQCSCGRPACGCSQQQECTYQRNYAEQSSSTGILMLDDLELGESSVPLVFGCETSESGEIFNQEADGILGLGNSEISLVNQLAGNKDIEDVFSLCFGSVEGDGALLLGDVDLDPWGINLTHTPLLPSAAHPHYYCVGLEGIAVGDRWIDVPPALYQEGYGSVLDSGTTFTYLPSEVFRIFVAEVTEYALGKGLKEVNGPDAKFKDVCFGGAPTVDKAAELEEVFPVMRLKLAGAVDLRLGPLTYLFMHAAEAGAYCLGVFDNGASGTLLGGITFRNTLVQYDRRSGRVGFGAAPCQAIGLNHRPCHASGVLDQWKCTRQDV
ncbi:hypothetical protein WJX73_004596 [Symbiochloris irregularis]|uniref:Peptidase A1 domain-containing protein n=1 Tax=Symbiochloris irregularis TaxID=706552 RepID=A0AAW1PE24_9CHLO